jgi:hypothetical protein
MRLLQSRTLSLHEFTDNEIPKYAILSHRWGREEVFFQDIQSGDAKAKAKKAGYSKIQHCGRQAAADGFAYFWVDTCCIDKSSSAELSEAINSMYRWYQQADTCYAYLSDVPADQDPTEYQSSFQNSEWFTRGWTLQELIAPRKVVFYGENWGRLGTKLSLCILISEITGVDFLILTGKEDLGNVSIARRMSWAAKRKTTRVEDIAYSLLGIFDVNMPLLYGEGEKAFIRLQGEIMRDSDDHSLFAWKDDNAHLSHRGLLASSPIQFKHSGDFRPYRDWDISSPYSLTNLGLSIQLFIIPSQDDPEILIATLNCQCGGDFARQPAIYLECISNKGSQFARIKPNEIAMMKPGSKSKGELKTIYIRQKVVFPKTNQSEDLPGFWIQPVQGSGFKLSRVYPQERWNPLSQTLRPFFEHTLIMGVLFFEHDIGPDKQTDENLCFKVRLGVQESKGWCEIGGILHGQSPDTILKQDFEIRPSPASPKTSDTYSLDGNLLARVDLTPELMHGTKVFIVQVSVHETKAGLL